LKQIFQKITLIDLFVIVLLIVILLQRYGGGKIDVKPSTHDTSTQIHYVYVKDSGHTKPVFVKGGRDTILENTIEYVPSDDYDVLYKQFQELKQELLSKNIYKDSIPVDTFGYVKLTDTLQLNRISGRGFSTHVKIPEKTISITNTIYPKPKNQFYIGGGVYGSQLIPIKQVDVSILLKNKKDQIFGISGGVDLKGGLIFGVQSFWKIKLHK
jgi:hypothetical protein